MTIDEFLTTLATIAPQFCWTLSTDTGQLRGQSALEDFCVLTALACVHLHQPFSLLAWDQAALALDLALSDASDIVDAADDPDTAQRALRRALLKAVGVEEP